MGPVDETKEKDESSADPGSAGAGKSSAKHWTRNVTAWIAIVTFAFGAGNVTDLGHRLGILPPPPAPPKTHLTDHLSTVNDVCKSYLVAAQQQPTVDWLNRLVTGRFRFVSEWATLFQGGLADAEEADMVAAREQFRAATSLLSAMANDLTAKDYAAYDEHLAQYFQRGAEYYSTVVRHGTRGGCVVSWPDPTPLTP
jgi:hypothetical protein